MTFGAGLDIGIYLLAYFIRLRIMSGAAKSSDANENKRFFVEEQMVATPLVVIVLSLWALSGIGSAAPDLRAGFVDIWASPVILTVLLVGVFSQGTGVFGGLILLDKRENTFCVPVNRASSILAGVVASFSLAAILDTRTPSSMELLGAGLIVMAIVVLSVPPLLEKRRKVA
jgi:drug/metabolite transporter (DMT)-like permease